jgi:hypothetical protein
MRDMSGIAYKIADVQSSFQKAVDWENATGAGIRETLNEK